MQRIEDLLIPAITTHVPGHHLAARCHLDAFDVALDRHALIGAPAWYAVAVVVEAHGLVLVHLGRLHDAGIEGVGRQSQGTGAVTLEALADRLVVALHRALGLAQTARTQMHVESAPIRDLKSEI